MANPELQERFLGIVIEGIGFRPADGLGQSNGLMISTRRAPGLDGVQNYDVKPYLLTEGLGSIDESVNPFRAEATWSAYTFKLEGVDELAERLFYEEQRASGTIDATITDGNTTSIDIKSTASLADQVVYIGDETLELGSVTATSGSVRTYNIDQRGLYSSDAQHHIEGANVFERVPYWTGRRVWLYSGEDAGDGWELEQRWVGRISDEIQQDRGTLELPCRQGTAGIQGLKRGREDRQFETMPAARFGKDLDVNYLPVKVVLDAQGGYSGQYVPKIRKADVFTFSRPDFTNDAGQVAFEVQGEVVKGWAGITDGEWDGEAYFYGEPLFGSAFSENLINEKGQGEEISPEDVHEVFAMDRTGGNNGFSSLDGMDGPGGLFLEYRFHPLVVFGCMVLSRPYTPADFEQFDVLQGDWSINLCWLFRDDFVEVLWNAIHATPDLKVDQIKLGSKGDSFELWSWCIEHLLHPYGFFPTIDNNGKCSIARLEDTDVQFYDDSQKNQVNPIPAEVLELSNGRKSSNDVVEVQLGQLEGIYDGRSIYVQAVDDAVSKVRSAQLQSTPDLSVNYSTISTDREEWVRNEAIGKLLMQYYSLPQLRVRVEDHVHDDLDYSLGAKVALKDLNVEPEWLVDKDGNRVLTIDDDVQWTGYIIGRRYLPKKGGYELTMLLLGVELIRWRAPSGIIQSSSGAGTAQQEIELGGTNGKVTAFGDDQPDPANVSNRTPRPDATRFTPHDEILIWSPDGSTLWDSVPKTVAGTLDNDSDGKNETIALDGSYSTEPPAGYVVELAWLDSGTSESPPGYENDGLNGKFDFVDRAYFFLADNNDTLGDEDLDADTYGAT